MKDILDEIEHKNERNIFSKLSFLAALINGGILLYIAIQVSKPINAIDGLHNPSPFLPKLSLSLTVLGMVVMVLSFFKKEPLTLFKLAGGILNGLIFLLMMGLFIFVRIVG